MQRLLFTLFFLALVITGTAQVPLYTYNFNGNLNEAGGGPTLTEVGAGITGFGSTSICGSAADNTYTFPSGRGLRMDVAAPVSVYSVELWFTMTTTAGYRRILDYSGLTSDCGLYELSGGSTLYCVGGSGGAIAANTNTHIIVTRDASNLYSVYVNGCPVWSVTDGGGTAIISAANDLILFKDNGTEESAGSCALFNFYDVALSPAQASAKYNAVCPASGTPGVPGVMTYDMSTGTLLEQTLGGPALTELANTTPADGFFTTGTPCGVSETIYQWPTNAGLQYNNTAAGNFMGQNHTVELFMLFDNLASWKRILDYSNRTQDLGVYAFNGAIQFYNFGTSGTVPFAAGAWSHVLLVRRKGITPCMDSTYYDMYVDGVLRITLTNTGTNSMLSAANLLNFFQDDLAIGGEASSGSLFYIRIYNYAMNATQAFTAYTQRCDVIVLGKNDLLLGITPLQGMMQLSWEEKLDAISAYSIERSSDGTSFAQIGEAGGGAHRFVDKQLPAEGALFYRITARLRDGSTVVSNTVVADVHSGPEWLFFPNPAHDQFVIVGPGAGAGLYLYDAVGRQVPCAFSFSEVGWQVQLPDGISPGVYLIRVKEGERTEVKRMVVQ